MTEGEEILFGTGFGIVTDIQTGPDGALYLVGPRAVRSARSGSRRCDWGARLSEPVSESALSDER